jgi:myo-inositol-hexaphosphate 3-phosphohydrolase
MVVGTSSGGNGGVGSSSIGGGTLPALPKKGVLRNSTSAIPTSSSCGSLSEVANNGGPTTKPVKRLRFALEDQVCYYCDHQRKELLSHPSNKIFFRWTLAVSLVLLFVFITFPKTQLDPYNPFQLYHVRAAVETHLGPSSSFSGVSLWSHPHYTNRSLIITVVDEVGLAVFDSKGKRVTNLKLDSILPSSISIDYNVFQGFNFDVISTVDRTSSSLVFFHISEEGVIARLGETKPLMRGTEITAMCTYRNIRTGDFFAFVLGEDRGRMEQWRISLRQGDVRKVVDTELVRSIEVGSLVTSCVADTERGVVYFYEQEVGIWRYGASPSHGNHRSVVDTKNTTSFGPRRLKHGANNQYGGMTIYRAQLARGYLLVTNPGESHGSSVLIYGRGPENRFINRFRVLTSAGSKDEASGDLGHHPYRRWSISSTTSTYTPASSSAAATEVIKNRMTSIGSGIGVLNSNLGGSSFGKGILVLQKVKKASKESDSLELISWEVLANTIGCRSDARKHLIVDPLYDLRVPYLRLHPKEPVETPSVQNIAQLQQQEPKVPPKVEEEGKNSTKFDPLTLLSKKRKVSTKSSAAKAPSEQIPKSDSKKQPITTSNKEKSRNSNSNNQPLTKPKLATTTGTNKDTKRNTNTNTNINTNIKINSNNSTRPTSSTKKDTNNTKAGKEGNNKGTNTLRVNKATNKNSDLLPQRKADDNSKRKK